MKEKSYHTIKKLKLGQTSVEICIENIPSKQQIRERLINIYDIVNDISKTANLRGVNTHEWFYTSSQLKNLKKDTKNNFI